MRGPAPKKNAIRRNKQPDRRKLVATTHAQGPELPKGVLPMDRHTGKRQTWHPMTKKMWHDIRRSPQANLIHSAIEWDYLLDTALMHHMMWTTGRFDQSGEVRMRLAKFGITPEDQLRLRIEIEDPSGAEEGTEPGVPTNVTSLQAQRERLTRRA